MLLFLKMNQFSQRRFFVSLLSRGSHLTAPFQFKFINEILWYTRASPVSQGKFVVIRFGIPSRQRSHRLQDASTYPMNMHRLLMRTLILSTLYRTTYRKWACISTRTGRLHYIELFARLVNSKSVRSLGVITKRY